jgi:hypothetical protein
MEMEKDIAVVSGIPYLQEGDILNPLTKINIDELKIGASAKLISSIKSVLDHGEALK